MSLIEKTNYIAEWRSQTDLIETVVHFRDKLIYCTKTKHEGQVSLRKEKEHVHYALIYFNICIFQLFLMKAWIEISTTNNNL